MATSSESPTHECPTCGREFGSEKGKNIHHANAHGESLAKTEYTCDQCGGTFERYRCNVEGPGYEKVFCSDDCQAKYQESLPPEEHPRWKGGPLTLECAHCNEEFERERNQVQEDAENHFCTTECYGRWLSKNIVGEDHHDWAQVQIECDWCGEPTYKRPARVERSERDFCSPDCHNKWMAENQVGPNHHQWAGGRPDYGEGWTPKKRERVREQADRKCEGCGMPEENLLAQSNRKLHVHHKVPAKQFDDPEKRNAMENLAALCLTCHFKAEAMAPLYPFDN